MQHEVVNIRIGLIWIDEDGIFRLEINAMSEIVVEDIHEINRTWEHLTNGRTMVPVLANMRNIKSATREARNAGLNEISIEATSALGLIVGSPVSAAIGNLFLRLTRPPYPTRIFTNENTARLWLKQFLVVKDGT